MPLTEKTLELNITHELLEQADYIWYLLNFAAFSQFPFLRRIPRRLKPPSVTGLALGDEVNFGYDIRLEIPGGILGTPRIFFIQYKLAHHCNYSTRTGSLFKGSRGALKPHCLFGINNNSRKDQHIKLKAIANNPNHRNAVLYALPRIPTVSAFNAWVGRLSHFTTWLRVYDVDSIAANQGILIQQGYEHNLAISYDNVLKEIRSEPKDISDIEDITPNYISEFTKIRVLKILLTLQPLLGEYQNLFKNKINWLAIFKEYLLNHARYWAVSSDFIHQSGIDYGIHLSQEDQLNLNNEARKYLNKYSAFIADFGLGKNVSKDITDAHVAYREKIFYSLLNALKPYYLVLSEDDWYTKKITEQSTSYSIPLSEEDHKLSFAWEGMEGSIDINLGGISYYLT